jgi:hypothetical protein
MTMGVDGPRMDGAELSAKERSRTSGASGGVGRDPGPGPWSDLIQIVRSAADARYGPSLFAVT